MDPKTQQLVIDLERNEELAKLVADSEPGDKLTATLSIVAKNDSTLTVEIEEVVDEGGDDGGGDDDEEEEKESPDSEYETPAMKVMNGKSG
jgi:hypothetical protein